MGIPGFASRMRHHGSTSILGREGEPRNDPAIIDGPSLAHAILQQPLEGTVRDCPSISPRCDYSALGRAAIAWLDNLEEHGFVIEAIYFDGALPEHKKSTRIERLQAYIDKLVVFKTVHDELTKASRNSTSNASQKNVQHKIEATRRSLPPPPFLVFAVIEALRDSRYSSRTFVVDGEADDFCAAKAMNMSKEDESSHISIFTNDSDLIIPGFGDRVRVVLINEISSDDDGGTRTLTGVEFWPCGLRTLEIGESLPDLVHPAFLMKNDSHLSYRNALTQARQDRTPFESSDCKAFATAFDLTQTRRHSCTMAGIHSGDRKDVMFLDSRVSEIFRRAVKERYRIQQMRSWYATEDERALERMKADIGKGWNGGSSSDIFKAETGLNGRSKILGSEDGVDVKDFAHDQKEEDLSPSDLDIFLPVLFEDTSRASPWKAGHPVREVAMHIATRLSGTAATVYEYKRSGQRLRATACQKMSNGVCDEALAQWSKDWSGDLQKLSGLEPVSRWKVVVMKLLLVDMAREQMTLPNKDAIVRTLANSPASTWDHVHLHAQYQAEFYSLRMLKQVLGFMMEDEEYNASGCEALVQALRVLESLPGIAAFCDSENHNDKDSHSEWDNAAGQLLKDAGVLDEPKSKSTRSERDRAGRKKRKVVRQSTNAFSSLAEDAEA